MADNENIFDVILIGAGPAGLFAVDRLLEGGLSVLVVDRGEEPSKRDNMNFGIGGAGAFSDGKLNLTHRIGGDPNSFGRTPFEVEEAIQIVDDVFTEMGVEGGYSGTNGENLQNLLRTANAVGVEFIFAKQRHVGTDRLHVVIDRFYKRLLKKGAIFKKNTRVESIYKEGDIYKLIAGKKFFKAKAVIAAPGRAGAYWLREQSKHLGVKTGYGPIDVGIRVEFPAIIYSEIAKVMYDAKFRLYSKSYDDLVRTFCTNPNGYIVSEKYDDFVLVNGHAKWNS
ncbi:MAG: NAD(P)/FAD-dependent oxidoreductase, partial [Candidatus Marinimicrobia bacterium]|nr:NAD(P)/FAD-dependent oxidoreductase [Candidatus Neomarinimicrobiota bacterium]